MMQAHHSPRDSSILTLVITYLPLQTALLGKHFSLRYEDVVTSERLIFGDFLVPGADPKIYGQITDMGKLVKVGGAMGGAPACMQTSTHALCLHGN